MINSIVPIKWNLVELICVTYKWALVGPDTRHLMYHLLNNFDTRCTICFHNSIMNNFICVITLTLFSINSVFDVPSRSYSILSYLNLLIYFIYLFIC